MGPNCCGVLFDKIASTYFIRKYIYILALEMASPGNQHCANCIGTLSFPTGCPVLDAGGRQGYRQFVAHVVRGGGGVCNSLLLL